MVAAEGALTTMDERGTAVGFSDTKEKEGSGSRGCRQQSARNGGAGDTGASRNGGTRRGGCRGSGRRTGGSRRGGGAGRGNKLTMVVRMVSTSERNGRKRKERKNACSGEPHSGREKRKWVESGGGRKEEGGGGYKKKKDWEVDHPCFTFFARGFSRSISSFSSSSSLSSSSSSE
jgi:hypothetical protein